MDTFYDSSKNSLEISNKDFEARSRTDSIVPTSAKVIIVGETGVGKTAILANLAERPFVYNTPTTIGYHLKKSFKILVYEFEKIFLNFNVPTTKKPRYYFSSNSLNFRSGLFHPSHRIDKRDRNKTRHMGHRRPRKISLIDLWIFQKFTWLCFSVRFDSAKKF